MPERPTTPIEDRFWAKVEMIPMHPCWGLVTHAQIARLYGISNQHVADIINRKKRRYVD